MRMFLPVLLLLAACAPPAETPRYLTTWRCGPEIVFDTWKVGERIRLDFVDRRLELEPVEAASGSRYATADTGFWQKADAASLMLDGQRHDCRIDRSIVNAVERGIDFRAIGQEPGWLLDIARDERITLQYDYGEATAEMPFSEPEPFDGGWRYRLDGGDESMQVTIVTAPCRDAMSGQPWPNVVNVHYRKGATERVLEGCGRVLPDAE